MTVGSFKAVSSPTRPRHTTLAALIAANAITFVALTVISLFGNGIDESVENIFCLTSDKSSFAGHPWTLVTYTVAQANVLQLLFNMLWLYCFGRLLMLRADGLSLLLLYLAGGIVGGLSFVGFYGFFNPGSPAVLMGSSASIIAVAAAVAFIMPDMKLSLPIIGLTRIKWIVLTVVILFCIGLSSSNAGGNLAHLGGALTGAAYGIIIRLRKSRKLHGSVNDEADYLRLIDQVRRCGYGSLSDKEKRRLFELSRQE